MDFRALIKSVIICGQKKSDHRLTQIDTDCEPLVQIKSKYFFMLRDYQIEICERVREAFARHRSVMVQMPTGTGKTVVLAELVREYLNVNLNGGRNVLIVAHRRELVEQIQQALLKVMGAEDESSTSFGKYPSFRSLASKKGLVTEKVFLPHPSSPARRGSTSPSAPPPQEGGLKAWPAGPVLASKLSPLRGCS